jgi:hypothetical protein
MSEGGDRKTLKLKRGDIRARKVCDLPAVMWKDEREAYLYMLANMQSPPAERNFCNEHEKAVKPYFVEAAAGRVLLRTRQTEWQAAVPSPDARGNRQTFFHLLDLIILNIYIFLSSCSGNKNYT